MTVENSNNVHVLVLAMSELHNVFPTKYKYFSEDGSSGPEIQGYGQLEVIPQFIQKYLNMGITHIIILETKLTLDVLDSETVESIRHCQSADNTFLPQCSDDDVKKMTAVSFFQERMTALGIHPKYIDVGINENDPSEGLEDLLKKIRSLYRMSNEIGADWKLWLDIHGGFREISMAMFSLMQILSATDITGFPKLQDNNKIVPVDGVYTTLFNHKGDVTRIKDRTGFYSDFTVPSLNEYLNYGQYLKTMLKPYEGNHPYAFLSYKHGDAEKERLAVMSLLKENGIRYWYDDAIHVGTNWAEKLDCQLTRSENVLFIALISENYLGSYQCLKELRKALDLHKKIILVSLDKTPIYFADSLRAGEGEDAILIQKEELNELSKKQHIDLNGFIVDGIFQQKHLLDELLIAEISEIDLCRNNVNVTSNTPSDPDVSYFVNLSNHESAKWSDKQRIAAEEMGPIADIPFPPVDPTADETIIEQMAERLSKTVLEYHPIAVMIQGESTLQYALVKKLQNYGIDCVAACSDRLAKEYTDETGKSVKNSVFDFVQFRKYPKI